MRTLPGFVVSQLMGFVPQPILLYLIFRFPGMTGDCRQGESDYCNSGGMHEMTP